MPDNNDPQNAEQQEQQGGPGAVRQDGAPENQGFDDAGQGDRASASQQQEGAWRPTDEPIGQAEGTGVDTDTDVERGAGTDPTGQGAASGQGGGL